jgi:UDP-N-acetylglucosamine 2-epimerase (non-hydrolysing)
VFFVGNVMIDTLLKFRAKAAQTPALEQLGLESRRYCVATLHRPSNVDSVETLEPLIRMLAKLSERLPVVFPVHPRTQERINAVGIATGSLILTAPMGYLEFLRLLSEARLVLTDSGGIQEETTILKVPCLTLRENTERPVTIECGTNRLVGVDAAAVFAAAVEALDAAPSDGGAPELWDGAASGRILDILERHVALRAAG